MDYDQITQEIGAIHTTEEDVEKMKPDYEEYLKNMAQSYPSRQPLSLLMFTKAHKKSDELFSIFDKQVSNHHSLNQVENSDMVQEISFDLFKDFHGKWGHYDKWLDLNLGA